jgi:hypothetical protein
MFSLFRCCEVPYSPAGGFNSNFFTIQHNFLQLNNNSRIFLHLIEEQNDNALKGIQATKPLNDRF